jgi:hypothetical protein
MQNFHGLPLCQKQPECILVLGLCILGVYFSIINTFFCSTLSGFENFRLRERILINVTICQNETSS